MTTGEARSGTGDPAPAGVLDLYRAIWATAVGAVRRQWVSTLLAVAFLAAYVALRSLDPDRNLLIAWVVLVGIVTILSPVTGLMILIGIAPFTEPVTVSRQLGVRPVLITILGAAVAVRFLAARARPRPPLPVVLAVLLALGTAAGVGVIFVRYGLATATDAGQIWLAGIGGGMVVLVAAAWLTRNGDRRPLTAAVLAAIAAAIVSLVDFKFHTLLRGGPLDWTVRSAWDPGRLMGVIPAPNGTAALLIGPAALLIAVAMLGRDARLRVASAVASIPLLVAMYFTFSRAALLGVFLVVVICAWKIRKWAGVAVLVIGLVGAIVLLPAYLQARGQSIGGDYARPEPGQLLIPSDRWRLQSWSAASRMWADQPLTGQGFFAYGRLAVQYGDTVVKAPHNEILRLFAEEGLLVGIVGISFAVATLAWLRRDRSWLGVGILAAFVGWCLAASFNNPIGYVQVNTIIFAIVGTGIARTGWTAHSPARTGATDAAAPEAPAAG